MPGTSGNYTRAFDTNNLDRLDYLIAEFKKRGIYTSLAMNMHRKFKESDGVRDWKIPGIGNGATYFNHASEKRANTMRP